MRICSRLSRLVVASFWTVLLSPAAASPGEADGTIARAVSIQGSVESQRAGTSQWEPVKLNDTFSAGGTIRVGQRSRADLALLDQSVLRLSEDTTITLQPVKPERIGVLDLVRGAVHFFSRGPRSLEVKTEFVAAGVRGTEFYIRVEADSAQATVPGLYAAGESAAGLHGANRLGGNSLSDLLVFGRRAGRFAARSAKAMTALPELDEAQLEGFVQAMAAPLDRPEGESPFEVHKTLQTVMEAYVGIIRSRSDLEKGLAELAKLKARAAQVKAQGARVFNPGWHLALDLESMLTVSEACASAALAREESRGGHTREDFPESRGEFATFNHVVKKGPHGPVVRREPLPAMPAELKALIGGK